MHPEEDRAGDKKTILLAALLVLALVLRFWRLGDWNFQATEIFTLRDSAEPQFHNWRPLGYLLNYFLVRPFHPLDEFGLRLLPAVFGVLAIPAFYLVSRRLIGARAALLGTLLLVVSPMHVMYSQLARYWSLVFLFCAIYPYALYLGIRHHNRRAVVVGVLTGGLAVLAHPVSILLLGGPALLLLARLRRQDLTKLWARKTVRWTALILVLFGGVAAVRVVPMLQGWITEHDNNPGSSQFLLRTPVAPGLKQIFYLFAYADSLTLPLVLIGMVGIYLLWHQRDRRLAVFLASLAAFPVIFLTLLSLRTPVSIYYLLPTAAVFFLGAGVFLDQLFELDSKLRSRGLMGATVTAIVIATGVPTLISDYRDGRRWDFRGVARWLEPRLTAEDVVFSDQHMVLAHYLPAKKVERLRNAGPLEESILGLQRTGGKGALWIVSPAPSHPFRGSARELNQWMYAHCRLRNTFGVGRVDFRQNYLQVFRCPADMPAEAAVTSK
jgi:uncharacterized membrane protein